MDNSIIVPIFNAEETLFAVMMRLLEELPKNSEIIVVDDCSTDNSSAIAKQFPIQLIQQEINQGPSAARNRGAQIARGVNLIFVDSDVELEKGALQNMLNALAQHPEILGINGLPSEKIPYSDWASNYVNLSLVYQLVHHGERVNTCFTSLCLLKKETWKKMGGWDEGQVGRYVDDVQTRWFLPQGSILQAQAARFVHHKQVSWRGLFRHRFNVGFHFWRGIPKEEKKKNKGFRNLIIHLRYPLNTALALSCFLLPIFPLFSGLIFIGAVLNNLGIFVFVLREQGFFRALTVFPLSLLEGFAFLFGIGWGGLAKYAKH